MCIIKPASCSPSEWETQQLHNARIAVTDGICEIFVMKKADETPEEEGKLRRRKGLLSMQLLTAIWFIADHWSRSGSRLDRLDIYNFARMHTRLAHHFFISIQIENYWNDLLHISPLWFLASRAPLFRDTWSTFLGRKDIPFASDSYSQSDPPRALVTFASHALVCLSVFRHFHPTRAPFKLRPRRNILNQKSLWTEPRWRFRDRTMIV